MANCQTCAEKCCVRPCVAELNCVYDCCGCCHLPVLMGPNLDLQAGQLLGQRTTDLRYYPFDPSATDGTQVFRSILRYHVQTDDQGHVTHRYFSHLGLGLDCGPLYTNAYVCGMFRSQELFGELASAAASGGLRLVDGTYEQGIVKLT